MVQAVPGALNRHLLPPDPHLTFIDATGAEDGLRQLRPARSDQAGDPNDFSAVHRKADPGQLFAGAQSFDTQNLLAHLLAARREGLRQRPADHHPH